MLRQASTVLLLLFVSNSWALDWDLALELEGRSFYELEPAQHSGSVAATLELFQRWNRRREILVAELFLREDADDPSRSHGDVRELYYHHIAREAELRIGARRVYWGVTESRHLVDIINQSDLVEDIDGEAKLGQPMFNTTFIGDWGSFDFFLMPYARARTFPGTDGLPQLPFPVAVAEAQYESSRQQTHLDSALRWRSSIGNADIGISFFHGTAREPLLLPCLRRGSGFEGTENGPNCDPESAIPDPGPLPEQVVALLQALGLAPGNEEVEQQILDAIVLVPRYELIDQLSLDAQYIIGATALKLEARLRRQFGRWNLATVSGFEHTFGDVAGSGIDVGLLAEYLYEERGTLLGSRFDDDWFAGLRLGFNDIAGTQVLAGGIVEADGRNRLFSVEASRRLGNNWRLALEARIFSAIPDDDPLAFFADQDHLRLELTRYF